MQVEASASRWIANEIQSQIMKSIVGLYLHFPKLWNANLNVKLK